MSLNLHACPLQSYEVEHITFEYFKLGLLVVVASLLPTYNPSANNCSHRIFYYIQFCLPFAWKF